MEYTGERPTLQHGIDGSTLRYYSVIPFCLNKTVLDWGCGIGSGSHLLSHYAQNVTGYDINLEAISEAQKIFQRHNLQFQSDVGETKFDIIASVECIEHIEKDELEKTLKLFTLLSDELIVTTPNGDYYHYHPLRKEDRIGFHVWHYEYIELKALLSKFYSFVEIYGSIKDPTISSLLGYVVFCSNKVRTI